MFGVFSLGVFWNGEQLHPLHPLFRRPWPRMGIAADLAVVKVLLGRGTAEVNGASLAELPMAVPWLFWIGYVKLYFIPSFRSKSIRSHWVWFPCRGIFYQNSKKAWSKFILLFSPHWKPRMKTQKTYWSPLEHLSFFVWLTMSCFAMKTCKTLYFEAHSRRK